MKLSFKSLKQRIVKSLTTSAFAAVALLPVVSTPMHAYAAANNITPAAKVSFTFDDGTTSSLTQAAPTLAKYGFSATNYVITGCVGMTTVPNTCHANNDASYMSWAQIQQLRTTYGWEIGSHTVTHPYLASSDASDGQPQKLTPAQVTAELVNSKAALAAQGINATAFAAPYGDYNPSVLAQIAKYYTSMRGFADTGYNTWPYSDYLVRDQQVQAGVSVATVKGYIDTAIANNQWLVLTFHDIKTNASTNPDDYEYKTADLDAIAAYVKSKNLPVTNMSSNLVTSDTNLLANSSFNNGIADGWTTDAATKITKDTANNGSFPDATNSIKFVYSTRAQHLFSPKVTVNSGTTYLLKNFINVPARTSGEVSFYIDEYNSAGNWISGQYKKAEASVFAENLNFTYKPTSTNVSAASLQIGITANSGITAYLDNSQWFALTTVATPAPTLLGNETFDATFATSGWSTNSPSTITRDTLNNGSPANIVNSAKLVASAANTYLFSPKMAIDSAKNYSFSSYTNIKTLTTGEIGYYIDEYDALGNWISGQYKTGARAAGVSTVTFDYKPTSANVKSSSLQVIVVGNSGITAYVDDIKVFSL